MARSGFGHLRNPIQLLVPAKRQVQANRCAFLQVQVARNSIGLGDLRQYSGRRRDLFDSVPDNQRDILVFERGDGYVSTSCRQIPCKCVDLGKGKPTTAAVLFTRKSRRFIPHLLMCGPQHHARVLLSMRARNPACPEFHASSTTLFGQGDWGFDMEVPADTWRSCIRLASADDKCVIA